MHSNTFPFAIIVLCGAALSGATRTQCSTFWSSAAPQAELSGFAICSTLWDPDGAGPAPRRLVVGGDSLVGGSAAAEQRVMTWDGSQWQALGSGPGTTGTVHSLTTWNGLLVASGTFTGGGTDHIALWNGSAWQALGPGLANSPTAIAEWNGNLVAATNSNLISIWNGAAWTTLPTPPGVGIVRALTQFQGLLCVAGRGLSSSNGALDRWNGTSWLASIPANGRINSMSVRSFSLVSSLYVAGEFTTIGAGATSAARIASTSGGTTFPWSPVGHGLSVACQQVHARATSALGTAVVVQVPSIPTSVMQLSGSSFVSMGTVVSTSVIYFGGSYHITTGLGGPVQCMRHNGTTWVPVLGQSIDGEVRALAPSGPDMIVGGTIQSTAGTALNRIARWNGTTFQPLGTGMTGTSVDALLTLTNGDIVAGGLFPTAGGLGVNNIARWNGTTWSGFGTGTDQQVLALCRMPNGDIVAAGRFTTAGGVPCSRIGRWNGTAWAPLGLGMNGDVMALAVRSDGTLFAGGAFTIAGTASCNRIAQWNGTAWSPLGFGVNGDVYALAVRPNGDVVATGAFTTVIGLLATRCARWTGSTWLDLGGSSGDSSPARALFALPNGNVVAGRGFDEPTANPDTGIARWTGFSWSGFGSGLAASTPGTSVAVRALAQRADGALIVGGDFGVAGGLVSHGLATLTSTCPALAMPYGAGCNGTAGPIVISAETLPWIGGSFRTATTNVAPGALCFGVTGFSQASIPLQLILPQGQPGCTLLAAPDILTLLLADGTGTARTALALAPNASLIGATFFQQTIPLEFNGAGALAAVRSTQGIAATVGTL